MAYDRTLIQIRERSFLDLLDLAIVVLRANARPVGLAALVGVLPFALFNYWITYEPDSSFPLYLILIILEVPWATAPMTVVLGSLMFGDRPSVKQVFKTLCRGLPAMLIYQLIVRSLLMISVIFYPLVPTRLAFMDEVILLERGKIQSAVNRCSSLTADRGADYFGQWLAQILFSVLFIGCFYYGSGMFLDTMFERDLDPEEFMLIEFGSIRFQLAVWIAIIFFGVARFLTYIDQRIRLEGWEIKLRLQAVGQALEEASRW